jgi:hypothetical protein
MFTLGDSDGSEEFFKSESAWAWRASLRDVGQLAYVDAADLVEAVKVELLVQAALRNAVMHDCNNVCRHGLDARTAPLRRPEKMRPGVPAFLPGAAQTMRPWTRLSTTVTYSSCR